MSHSEVLCDADGVERRPRAQVVRHHPQAEAVVEGGVFANASDEGEVFTCAIDADNNVFRATTCQTYHMRGIPCAVPTREQIE